MSDFSSFSGARNRSNKLSLLVLASVEVPWPQENNHVTYNSTFIFVFLSSPPKASTKHSSVSRRDHSVGLFILVLSLLLNILEEEEMNERTTKDISRGEIRWS